MEALSESRINYILEHIGHHAPIPEALFSCFRFGSGYEDGNALVYFPLSDYEVDLSSLIHIDELPVLYPVDKKQDVFYSMRGKNLVFHHDLLKSAFHLLSGYQEYQSEDADRLGRYPFTASIQHALGITTRPLVNYYFDIIIYIIVAHVCALRDTWKRKFKKY